MTLNRPMVTTDSSSQWPIGYPVLLIDTNSNQFDIFDRPKVSATTGWYRPGKSIYVVLLIDGMLLTAEIKDGDLLPLV